MENTTPEIPQFKCKACLHVGQASYDVGKSREASRMVVRNAFRQGGIFGSLIGAAITAAMTDKKPTGKTMCAKCGSFDLEQINQP